MRVVIIESEVMKMELLFDITKFDSYREDNRREVKRANGGLPISLWDAYSAYNKIIKTPRFTGH